MDEQYEISLEDEIKMLEEYNKAYKLGKKDYQARLVKGETPTLKVLPEAPIQNALWDWYRFPSIRLLERKQKEGAMHLPVILCLFFGKIQNLPINGPVLQRAMLMRESVIRSRHMNI